MSYTNADFKYPEIHIAELSCSSNKDFNWIAEFRGGQFLHIVGTDLKEKDGWILFWIKDGPVEDHFLFETSRKNTAVFRGLEKQWPFKVPDVAKKTKVKLRALAVFRAFGPGGQYIVTVSNYKPMLMGMSFDKAIQMVPSYRRSAEKKQSAKKQSVKAV